MIANTENVASPSAEYCFPHHHLLSLFWCVVELIFFLYIPPVLAPHQQNSIQLTARVAIFHVFPYTHIYEKLSRMSQILNFKLFFS